MSVIDSASRRMLSAWSTGTTWCTTPAGRIRGWIARPWNCGPHDTVLVITSAGCNALDYALAGPERVIAVDINPRQNALLELKLAGIRNLPVRRLLRDVRPRPAGPGRQGLRREAARPRCRPGRSAIGTAGIEFFEPGNRRPFYFRGTSGTFALLINFYIDHVAASAAGVECAARRSDGRRAAADLRSASARSLLVARRCGSPCAATRCFRCWACPRPSGGRSSRQYEGGIATFVHDCVEAVSPGCRWPTIISGAST